MALIALIACAAREDSTTKLADTASRDSGGGEDSVPPVETGTPDDTADSAPDTGPIDADGDHYSVDEDCDDSDREIHPGADEYCDAIDHDCDGDPVPEGGCGESMCWNLQETVYWKGVGERSRFSAFQVGWLDGNLALRAKDYSFQSDSVAGEAGAYGVIMGTPELASDWREFARGTWVIGPDAWSLQSLQFAGDVDGDGFDDIWLEASHFSYDNTELLLIRGPSSSWAPEGQYVDDIQAPAWPEDGVRLFLSLEQGGSADIDEDGFADLVTAQDDDEDLPGTVAVIFGHDDLANEEYRVEDGVWFENSLSLYNAFPGPDADGDGLLDILFLRRDYLLWAPGDILRASSGSDITDIASLLYLSDGADSVTADGSNPTVGDLDGNGAVDAVVERYHASDDTLCASFLDMSAAPTAATLDDAILAEACAPMDAAVNHTGNVISDLDGDGVTDVTVQGDADNDDWGAHGGAGDLRCVVPSHRLALGGRVEVRDIGLCYHGLFSVIPDVNDDGFADMIGANWEEYESDPDEYGRTDILFGWDIPWDDPTKW